MKYIVNLPYRKSIIVSQQERDEIAAAIKNKEEFVELGEEIIKLRSLGGVSPLEDEELLAGKLHIQRAFQEFADAEKEYREQSPLEKAKREYYSRFMFAFLGRLRIFGVSRDDFNALLSEREAQNKTLPGLKKMFLEYFEKNPTKTWMPYALWEGFLPENTPTYFEVIVLRHQQRVDSFYTEGESISYNNNGFDQLPED